MRLIRFHRRDLAPVLSPELVEGLVDAGIALEDAKREADERKTWVNKLRVAREENNLSERMRRAFDERD